MTGPTRQPCGGSAGGAMNRAVQNYVFDPRDIPFSHYPYVGTLAHGGAERARSDESSAYAHPAQLASARSGRHLRLANFSSIGVWRR